MKLAPAGAGDAASKNKKTFEVLVAEKTTEFSGDKNKAMTFCIQNFKAEYAEYRQKAFMAPKTNRTL